MELGSALSPRVFRVIEKIEYLGLSTARDLSKKHIFNLIRTHLTTIPRDASVMPAWCSVTRRISDSDGRSTIKSNQKTIQIFNITSKRFGALICVLAWCQRDGSVMLAWRSVTCRISVFRRQNDDGIQPKDYNNIQHTSRGVRSSVSAC